MFNFLKMGIFFLLYYLHLNFILYYIINRKENDKSNHIKIRKEAREILEILDIQDLHILITMRNHERILQTSWVHFNDVQHELINVDNIELRLLALQVKGLIMLKTRTSQGIHGYYALTSIYWMMEGLCKFVLVPIFTTAVITWIIK